jgi:hypothetical protein
MQMARRLITEKYPYILSIRCMATSNPGNVQLWKDAEAFLLTFNFENSYSNIQIANKWKNLVDNYKVFLKKKKYVKSFY